MSACGVGDVRSVTYVRFEMCQVIGVQGVNMFEGCDVRAVI